MKPIKFAHHLYISICSAIINFELMVTKKGLAKNNVTYSGKEIFDKEK